MPSPRNFGIRVAGGLALILGAIAFLGVFTYLAMTFDYPDVLDGSADKVLPALLATGRSGRFAWAVYALLPLIWLPAGVGAFDSLRGRAQGSMRLAMLFAALASISMMLGLMRWPSIHWELARAYSDAAAPERATIAVIFAGLNSYLGNYIGEFLGELCFNTFFLLSALVMLRTPAFPRWFGWWGLATAALGLIGMFRNVTGAVAAVADANNYLLPLWMIGFGVALIRYGRRPDPAEA
jgi:uncharacterized protein DUF4386